MQNYFVVRKHFYFTAAIVIATASAFTAFQTSDLKIADNYYIKFDVPIDVDTIHTAKRNEKHPCQKC